MPLVPGQKVFHWSRSMNKRWKMKVEGTVLTLEPDIKELNEWLEEKSYKMSQKINDVEETLLLKSLGDTTLENLQKKIKAEIKRRKEKKIKL